MPKAAKQKDDSGRRATAAEAAAAPVADAPRMVIVLSGGTGRTGQSVVASALAQFQDPRVQVVLRPNVRTSLEARKIVQQAAQEGAVIVHTVVAPKVRETIRREIERRNVPAVDVLGPVLNALADQLQLSPQNKPGLSYELKKESFDRIDAVDYTLAHDDGARLAGIDSADVVLVGTSRVSKSVTCFYLAYRGIRAANVPLIRGHPVPAELLRLDPKKVVALTMNAQRLQSIRTVRLGHIGAGELEHYTGREAIRDEIRYVNELITRHRWRSIDVSYMAVEEAAKEVIDLVGLV